MNEDLGKLDRGEELARRATGFSLEGLSKLLAGSVICLYASGYLVTSLYSFRYGFSELNPLRPHVLAAGVWFAFMLFVPLAILREVKAQAGPKIESFEVWERPIRWYYAILLASNLLVVLAGKVFIFDDITEPTTWKDIVSLCLLVVTGSHLFLFQKARFRKASALILGCLVCWSFYNLGEKLILKGLFTSSSITFWILGISTLVFYESVQTVPEGRWKRLPVELLVTLFIFSRYFYPHIAAAWGGGEPIPVTILSAKNQLY